MPGARHARGISREINYVSQNRFAAFVCKFDGLIALFSQPRWIDGWMVTFLFKLPAHTLYCPVMFSYRDCHRDIILKRYSNNTAIISSAAIVFANIFRARIQFILLVIPPAFNPDISYVLNNSLMLVYETFRSSRSGSASLRCRRPSPYPADDTGS